MGIVVKALNRQRASGILAENRTAAFRVKTKCFEKVNHLNCTIQR